ncbi:MAG: DUF5939 domain-containing protein, partial [Cyanobacteriota bacterium]
MNTELLKEELQKFKQRTNANIAAIDAIEDWLIRSHILQRIRINPYTLADDCSLPPSVIISEFLSGVKAGLFELHWDIHCPHCNMITQEFKNLADAKSLSLCQMCERDFEVDFLDRVEVTFSLNKQFEDIKLSPVCAPPPILNTKLQLVTLLNETAFSIASLGKGRYRYCCPLTGAKGILLVEGEETEELQEI